MPSRIARSTISSTEKSGCAGCSRWSRAAASQTSSATLMWELVTTATVEISYSNEDSKPSKDEMSTTLPRSSVLVQFDVAAAGLPRQLCRLSKATGGSYVVSKTVGR